MEAAVWFLTSLTDSRVNLSCWKVRYDVRSKVKKNKKGWLKEQLQTSQLHSPKYQVSFGSIGEKLSLWGTAWMMTAVKQESV